VWLVPKKDYFDDPHAPAANSLVVAVAVVVRNDAGAVLLIQRADNGLWALPGGAQDIGETTREAAIREVREETGIDVEITGISGIYSDPRHVIAYDDGEVRQEFSIVFHARSIGGTARGSDESRRVVWVDPRDLPSLKIDRSMCLRIEHGLEDRAEPYLS
jgi:8-oxo-dGTP pyrophosphatase MutT (NUDIX family)